MADTIYERIVSELADRIATCTIANGYLFDVVEVVRRVRGSEEKYVPGVVEIRRSSITQDGALDQGTINRGMWTMSVEVMVFVDQPDEATEPAETAVARAVAAVHSAVAISDRLGIADTAVLESIDDYEPAPGQFAGAALTYSFQFLMDETDLTQGRA